MKRLLGLVLVASAAAWAQGPDDFKDKARITIAEEDALQRLVLPAEVYRDAKPDLSDVRVLNGNGETVPIALGTEPERGREAQASKELPSFPVTSLDIAPEHVGVRIRLSDGTLMETRGKNAAGRTSTVKAWLLDASALKLPMRALMVDWDPSGGAEIFQVRLEGSSDLRSWHALPIAPVQLVHIEQGGRVLEQPRIPMGRSQEKYLRLTWDGPSTLRLRSVRAEFEDRLKPPDRMTSRVTGQKGEKPGEIVYDLGGRYPVEALRLLPQERNSVIPASFSIEEGKEAKARSPVTNAVFYSLTRNGKLIESPPLEIGRRSGRRWIASVDPNSGAVGQVLPDLEVQWRPANLIFVARGEGPFTLAFGDREAQAAFQNPSTLIPSYEAHAEDALPLAKLGGIERNLRGNRYPEWLGGVPPRRIALWTILIAAVAALGFMAWRLSAQMKRPEEPEDTDTQE